MTHILIDGYNLLAETEFKNRDALIAGLVAYKRSKGHSITIVFDGTKKGTLWGGQSMEAGVEVLFSPLTITADETIEKMLERVKGGSWLVVSSDRKIQKAALRTKATFVSSQDFAKKLASSQRSSFTSKQVLPWMEGREDDHRLQHQPKKGPAHKQSKQERKRRKKLNQL